MEVCFKRFLFFFLNVLIFSRVVGQPAIHSFAPTSGSIGSTVIIKGLGFSSVPSNNIVFFGAVKALVKSSTNTSLTVTVPAGASFEPISLTTNNLTCYSSQPFVITFPGAATVFPADLFPSRVDVPIAPTDPDNAYTPYEFCNVDIDGDGKPDMVSANGVAGSISVVQNTSVADNVSFSSYKDFAAGRYAMSIDHGDFDGDGKQDIAVLNIRSQTVSIFRNTSNAGAISFSAKVDIHLQEDQYEYIAINDVDGDGKPDFVITGNNVKHFRIYKNSSSPGSIQFASKYQFETGFYGLNTVLLRDLDGDSKPDLVIAYPGLYDSYMAIFRNKSVPGSIAFEDIILLNSANGPFSIGVGDLDGDGKPDLAVSNNQNNSFSVYRNTSSIGSVSFDDYIMFSVGRLPQKIAIGDIDGDGKLDVAVSNNANLGNTVSIYKNRSTVGNIGFQNKVDLTNLGGPEEVIIADMDGDGKPEIEVISDESIISVFTRCSNIVVTEQPGDLILCNNAGGKFEIKTNNIGAYQWQINKGEGWTEIIDDTVFSGAYTNKLSFTKTNSKMNGYKFRCTVLDKCGTTISHEATLTVTTAVTPSVIIATADTTICTGAIAKFVASTTNVGTSPVFQWQKNNINVGLNTNIYIDSSLINGDIISCILTSNANCLGVTSAQSNAVVVKVKEQVLPTVSITASTNNECYLTPVLFKALTVNLDSSASYHWMKNNVEVGTDNSIYIDSLLRDNDVIKCRLTSASGCGIVNAESNTLTIAVKQRVIPTISINASANNVCPGSTVSFAAITTNEGSAPLFSWKKNNVKVGNNEASFRDSNWNEGDIITCELTSNSNEACLTSAYAISNPLVVHLNPALPGNANLGEDKSICSNASTTLNTSFEYDSYLWQDGSINAGFVASQPGMYHVLVTDFCGRTSSDSILITLSKSPAEFLPADTSICTNELFVLKTETHFNNYLWSNGETTPSISIYKPGTYWLQVTDENNCKGNDTIFIAEKVCNTGVYFASAFTPNGDGKNEFFKPLVFSTLAKYDFTIFNRFGEVVYHSIQAGKGWDGSFKGVKQSTGTYVWSCIYQIEGEKPSKKTGTVTLLR